jgi:uncharacterized protein
LEKFCNSCGEFLFEESKFCSKCGKQVKQSYLEIRTQSLNIIITFYVTFLVFALVSFYVSNENEVSLFTEGVIESIFVGLVIGFCVFDYKNIINLYRLPKANIIIWIFSFVFPIYSSLYVYFFIEFINSFVLDVETINYIETYSYSGHPLFWAFIFVVILPPIFEELAFRGFLFNQLQKVTNNNVTVIATAFIFALVHFSFISFIWIFPFGIVLGYLRSKYKTLWLGIVIHFIHNLMIILIDYYFFTLK